MKRKNVFFVIAIVAVLALVGCSGKKETSGGSEIRLAQAGGSTDGNTQNSNSGLNGTWYGGLDDDYFYFAPPNYWDYGSVLKGTYSYNGSNLILTYEGKEGTSRTTISGNTLSIGEFSGAITSDAGINKMLPGTYQRSDEKRQWPTSAILSEYGLAGMPFPDEMTGINWNEEKDTMLVHIRFSGTDNTFTVLKNWFVSNGYTLVSDELNGRDAKVRYKKDRKQSADDEYFYITEVLFDGTRGYIRAAIDW